jgi:hypothetical protein
LDIGSARLPEIRYLWKSATTAAGSGTEELSRGREEAVAPSSRRGRRKIMRLDLGAPAMVPSLDFFRGVGLSMQGIL